MLPALGQRSCIRRLLLTPASLLVQAVCCSLTVDLTTFGYPNNYFGTLQFVPPGLPGAGVLKVPDFENGDWYDVARQTVRARMR